MKKIGFFFAALAMFCAACNQPQEIEETTNPDATETKMVKLELKVTIAQETKAVMNDKKLTFGVEDEIAVLGTKDNKTAIYYLTVSSVNEGVITFTTNVPEGTEIGDYAYYPSDLIVPNGDDPINPLTIFWPSMYYGSPASVRIPMMAKIELQSTTVFRHLGSLLKVNLVDVPSGNKWLEFKTSRKFVGAYTVNPTDWSLTLNSSNEDLNTEYLQATADGTYYIPIPPGEYADFQLGMMSADQNYPAYYYKQRTAQLTSPITPARTQFVNLGDFTYDVDEIVEWWHVSDINDWGRKSRYIKTGPNKYEIIAFNPASNRWWRLEDKDGGCWMVDKNPTAWNGTLSLMPSPYSFERTGADNKTFFVTLTKDGDNWVYNSGNWDNNADEWLPTDKVELRGDFDNWGSGVTLTKWQENYWSNYSYQYEGFEIKDNLEHEFKFVFTKSGNVTWGGGNVNLTDAVPYGKVTSWNQLNDNMKLRFTPGTYNVYINVADWNQGMIFMFVKQPISQQ